ncbi:lasso peptide biosynthesis PqqD family chaperone [Actinomadura harenae]|uniref:Lasso peptide biosynthesis PqqD family chaperone n=1 Tax=Actinomadura harenae TaxID=2483351 RepID=A0A3M2M3G9_9ACTN|nr:lasso peptide biosynthesis PqqD family chaperone [Actinomadura harenae]RMI43660.1 lasso peptide biosynthesis PqqD family chaperone [Actinomadura harenae]
MTVRLPEHVTLVPVPGSEEGDRPAAVLLDGRTGDYWQLNATAHLVLSALLDGASSGEAARALVDAHPEAAGRAQADVDEIVAGLTTAGLIE